MFARVVLLPLSLALAVVLGPGSYFETNDDGTMAWLLAGVLGPGPAASLPLYLHGYGRALAAGYAAAPEVPWLGLLLGGMLAAATLLWFAVLDKLLRPHLRPGWLLLALALFFALAWLEHWLWFSHARVALLLAAGGVLFAAQRPGHRAPLLLGLAALLAAWLVRPGLASLGALAALPAAGYLAGSWRRAAPGLLGAGLLLALAFGLNRLRQTPADARAQARDAGLTRILDYGLLRPHPRTLTDSLGTAAIGAWLPGDTALVDAALRGRVYRFEPAEFFGRVVPAKLALRGRLLLRDCFPVLLALLATVVPALRRGRGGGGRFWLVQLAFAAGLAGLAGILKLPPRLALPLLDCWLLTNLVFWLRAPEGSTGAPLPFEVPGRGQPAGQRQFASLAGHPRIGLWPVRPALGRQAPPPPVLRLLWLAGVGLVLAVVVLYTAKTAHRQQVLRQEQRQNQAALRLLRRRSSGAVRILAGTNDLLKSLSPFRSYSPGPGPLLQLSGWPALGAAQTDLRQALTGTRDQTECLRRLARGAGRRPRQPVWWLLTPDAAQWLNRRFRLARAGVELRPAAAPAGSGPAAPGRYYPVLVDPTP